MDKWELPEISTLRGSQSTSLANTQRLGKWAKIARRQRLVVIFLSDRLYRTTQIFVMQANLSDTKLDPTDLCSCHTSYADFFYVCSMGGPPLLGRTSIFFPFSEFGLPTTNRQSKWKKRMVITIPTLPALNSHPSILSAIGIIGSVMGIMVTVLISQQYCLLPFPIVIISCPLSGNLWMVAVLPAIITCCGQHLKG
jgi:hypothetical protein